MFHVHAKSPKTRVGLEKKTQQLNILCIGSSAQFWIRLEPDHCKRSVESFLCLCCLQLKVVSSEKKYYKKVFFTPSYPNTGNGIHGTEKVSYPRNLWIRIQEEQKRQKGKIFSKKKVAEQQASTS